MKVLKVLTICSLLAVSSQSFANTTAIIFPKGSYCSSFSGNVAKRTFSIFLGANQTLTVTSDIGFYDIIVKDPKGKILRYDGQDYGEWTTKMKGKHTIHLVHGDSNFANVEFCAY